MVKSARALRAFFRYAERQGGAQKRFVIYGFRSGEVARLRVEDLSWAQERILVTCQKHRCRQEYPLSPDDGEPPRSGAHTMLDKTIATAA